ncbi:hypothetical protein BOTBODRAFT_32312 [Botryobasidium botryosum FD-172 SS1]|uniref:Cytochrome b5 heme-binding domain-containing protein n=1 Tax=Botryobasidium botryosum (strain FD-172 SS1) TaxID=930990 RepID=A0A067MSX3_BOTB1|nr:hypothetical protein BOTBODRAFT_32312 [Botryobasidium botryosum FD-172 SS1]
MDTFHFNVGSLQVSPLNASLALVNFYFIYTLLFPNVSQPSADTPVPSSYEQAYTWRPQAHSPTIIFKKYTPKTLQPFDGKDGGRILLAIDRKVFDVSNGRSFYGPDGMYGNFAGRDASRGMAKQSFDLEMLTPVDAPLDPLKDLTKSERENMKGWIEHFSNKYIVCGELVENDEI